MSCNPSLLGTVLAILLSSSLSISADGQPPISFTRQVQPILRANCQGCHQPAKALGGYAVTSYDRLLLAGESDTPAVVPGKPDESGLVHLITPVDGSAAMPKQSAPLSASEIELIRSWIAQGAVNDSPTSSAPLFDAQHLPAYTRPPVITSITYSADGKWLAVNGFHEVVLVDSLEFRPVHRLVGLSQRIQSLTFSPDSARLGVTGGSPGNFGEVQIWDVQSGQLSLSRQIGYDTLFGGSFSPDGKIFAFGSTDRVVRAIDSQTGAQRLHQGAHEDWSLATVFNPSGTHLISGGRDMTVKLTEVATERFIDNVTSITPGALKGGVNALASHPTENQILVGGADGTPKIYRIFRETERRIGDDSNLIRKFPAMKGRIFDVDVASDGKLFAVASTLDGQSSIKVYPYDFTGEVPDNVKEVMKKTVDQRKEEERKLLDEFNSQTSPAISSIEIEDRIYAVAISPNGQQLAIGGAEGLVRVYSITSGELLNQFVPVPIDDPSTTPANHASQPLLLGSGLPPRTDSMPAVESEQSLVPKGKLLEIAVEPSSIQLASEIDYAQIIVTAKYEDGRTFDVTRLASISVGGSNSVDPLGVVKRISSTASDQSGSSRLLVRFQDAQAEIPIEHVARPVAEYDFIRDVNPVLSRLGCNAGTCHGAQQGKNGFQLSLRGYDPVGDVRSLSDDLSARRLNPAVPDASVMLLKPVGAIPHEGGMLMTINSAYYHLLQQWIAQGARLNTQSRKVERIEILPAQPVIESTGAWQQFRVTAHYPDGSSRDVTHETVLESSNTEVCQSLQGARVKTLRRGEAALLARYEGAYAAATITVMGERNNYQYQPQPLNNQIDQLVAQKWQRMKIEPSALCDDLTFLRRVRLDLTGLPPTVEELKQFLADNRPSAIKRQEKIDQLIGSEDYIELWTNKWSDLLQVNSKFLAAEGAAAFRGWIRQAVAENIAYDRFVQSLLTATGSNKENPAASYFKILREPELMMENTTHLFLAVRFNCNKCHDHPFERWTQEQYFQLSAYFAQTGLKEDPASNNRKIGGSAVEGAKPFFEEVFDKNEGEILHQRTMQPVAPKFPFDCDHAVEQGGSRRQQLAAWITSPHNPYFATSFVNRLWGYLTGTGLVEPLDDIRAGNPASNPELLKHLADEFVRSGFNVQHIQRLICNSRTYQLSVATNPMNSDDQLNYSHAKARRLPAEVLYDTVYRVTGAKSVIPGVEPGTRAAQLPDVAFNLPDGFLNNLGRPARESACECERSQELQLGPVMALVSGPTVGTAIGGLQIDLARLASTEQSASKGSASKELIEEVYLRVLNRYPTAAEIDTVSNLERDIDEDQHRLTAALAEMELWWAKRREELEAARLSELEKTRSALAGRQQEIAPERARLEQERQTNIATAQAALTEYAQDPSLIGNRYLQATGASNDWHPLAAISTKSSNKSELIPQGDRSIVVAGPATPTTYTVRFHAGLRSIRGLRLEALPVEGSSAGGAGLSGNGNFVVTEIELHSAPLANPEQRTKHKFASAKVDYSQEGFSAAAAIDGNARDQGGWAVSPRSNSQHWLTTQLAEPIQAEGPIELMVDIHQYHNADSHRLGRFRISVTTDEGEIHLGLPEDLSAIKTIAEKDRKLDRMKPLTAYVEANDAKWIELKNALGVAQRPVPADEPSTELEKQIAELDKVTPDDPKLIQLRADVAASTEQFANRRLTIAQDLAWALINSPAFLFNH